MAGYNGKEKGKDWVEKALGLTAEIVRHPPKPRYVWVREGEEPDWEKLKELLPKPGFKVLPRRWVVERTFSWTDQNRRMSKDYERVPETGVDVRSDDTLDDKAFGPLMKLFRQFLTLTSRRSASTPSRRPRGHGRG